MKVEPATTSMNAADLVECLKQANQLQAQHPLAAVLVVAAAVIDRKMVFDSFIVKATIGEAGSHLVHTFATIAFNQPQLHVLFSKFLKSATIAFSTDFELLL